ncbi:amino acid adenylation domain-containing protein [Nocardia sp. NPDC050713]|uniref:amino acid adenylation domain-containing protein n=1 Tax=Nocardia sp. NPDC050713 TaxID=3154511 RepID=UPI0033E335D7
MVSVERDKPRTDNSELPLTGAQLGIWNAQRLDPESLSYLVGEVLEISGPEPIDVALLDNAIRRTIAETDTMRLRFIETPDGPRQRMTDAAPEVRPLVDLRNEADPVAAAHRLVTAERERAARFCRGMVDRQLFTYTLLRLSDRDVWCVQLYHHLIIDGYSAALVSRRVAAHYTALRTGGAVPPLRWGSVATLVTEDIEYRASEAYTRDRDYWRDLLTPLPPLDGRGRAHEGPAAHTHEARAVLDADLVVRIKAAAEAAGTTWADVIVGCYAGFVHRLLGETDVVIALPVMARVGKTALTTPSMAVNVLPLRISVCSHDRLGELSKRVADALRDVRAHQRFRGEELARAFGGAQTGALLHGIGINLKAFDFALDFAGATGTLRNVAGGPPEDLGLTVTPLAQDRIQLGFEVDTRSLDAETVRRRLDALVRMITELVDGEDRSIGRVAPYPPEIGARITAERASAALPGHPEDPTAVFDRLVATQPDAVLLVSGADRLTAAELGARVHRLARYLRGKGVGPEDIVGIALPRTADIVIAILAVQHAGAAYLVLDTEHPAQRLNDIVDDAAPVAILTSGVAGDELFADRTDKLIRLSSRAIREAIDGLASGPLDATELAAPRSPGQLAYVVYTSGSTGRPKGVQVSCGAAAQLLHHHRSTIYAEAAERAGHRQLHTAHTASFAFDAALDQLLWLLCGHRVHLYDTDVQKDAAAQVAAFVADGIDVVDTTPSMAAALIDNGLLGARHRPELLLIGGEATPPALWSAIVGSGVPARNMYGPTEATVDALSAPVTGAVPHVGGPLAGTRAYLLDSALQPVPDGEIGELYLAGPQLARGYLGRVAVTAERFVADPFGAGERMYRTGDRARWLPGHGYEFLGRGDQQIKVRGYRVELGEVEAVLGALPGVAAAAAVIRKVADSTQLVGYLVPAAGVALASADELRHRLAKTVPDHLVPSAIVVLDALPTTVNGKLDRAALPAPQLVSTGRPPRTEPERALCAVVAEVLGVSRVSATDDFFGLGGDSITAISVTSRLRAHGLLVQPKALLGQRDLATIAAAAERVDDAAGSVAPDEATGVVPIPPLVAALLEANPSPTAIAGYAQWTALELHEDLALDHLVAGMQTLLDRHDALRLVLDGADAEPRLVVAEAGAVRAGELVVETVLPTANNSDQQADSVVASVPIGLEVERTAAALAAELDPARGVEIRGALVRTAPGTADRLVLVANHLVVDGVSWRILVPELYEACAAARDERPARLPAKGSSWRRYATMLADAGAAGGYRSELESWQRALGDGTVAPVGERPLDRARDVVETGSRSRTLAGPEVSEAVLSTLPAAYRARTDEVLLAALMLAVNGWRHDRGEALESGRPVTVEGHGRDPLSPDTDFAGTIGWFTSEYPVWTPATGIDHIDGLADALAGGAAAGRLLRAVKEAKRAVPGNGVGYGVLRRLDPDIAPVLAAQRSPELLINYLGRFNGGTDIGWRLPEQDAFSVLEPPEKALTEVLSLNVFVHEASPAAGPRIAVEWTAASRILGAATVAQLQRHWELALEAFAAHGVLFPGGLTPSDCQGVSVPQDAIDALEAAHGPLAELLPLSPLQEGLLFHAIRDGAADVYTLTARVDLTGPLDERRLSAAFDTVVARHPNMCAAFHYEGLDQPLQAVPRSVRMPWRQVDLSGLPVRAAVTAADRLEAEAAEHRFSVDESPMLRATLIRMPGQQYRLVLNAHHLIIDGWSTPIVLRELLVTYHGDELPTPARYSDYLTWIAARDHDTVRAAWARRLAGVTAPTLLRADTGREREFLRRQVPLTDSLAAALTELGRRRGLTMNTLVQGAWATVLAALTGRRDVVFGATVSGRPAELPGVEGMVGLFTNTVPVRCLLDPDRALLDQLAELQEDQFAMQEFDHAGLAEIERIAGIGQLFDTLVVFENFPNSAARQPDSHELRVGAFHNHGATHYPLTLVAPPGDRLELLIGYDRSAVADTTLDWIADRLRAILSAVTGTEDVHAAALLNPPGPLTEPVTSTRSIERTANSAQPIDVPDLYGETLADWGTTVDPDSPAITADGLTITYREFDARANRLARWLITQGIGPETVVAVGMPRTIDSVITAHAISRSGGVYLPVDLDQPAQRIERIFEIAAPALVLRTLDDVDTGGFADTEITDAERLAPLRPGNSAYLLFTSGSTGVPKGVTVSHAAIVNTFETLWRMQRFGPDDTVLYRTPPVFDASLLELYLPLHVGARIVLTRANGHRDPYYQAQLMREERVTTIQMTTSMLTVLAEEADLSGCTNLRCVITGGEALPPATAHRVRALTGAKVNNLYGPTEAAVSITYHETVDADVVIVPIGRPADGSGVRVLDDSLRPVAAGVIGDLYLTGTQLARGYLARPDLTAAAFVADPHGHGERMYRTGDLVKWNPDGELEYVGRGDSQVKLRGQRIELGDIESALLTCAGVAQAVVLLREDEPGDQRLAAYLIARSGTELDTAVVRAHLRKALPAHMIPAAFVVLDRIPRTASEKIDRRALPVPEYESGPAAPQRTSTESRGNGPVDTIREAMAAVLSAPEIGSDDDFFAAGGHSLTAVRLIGRLGRAGIMAVLDDVFAAPTPLGLAARLGTAEAAPIAVDGLALLGRRLDHVLELRTGGSAAPLFCVHPVGGTAWQFGPLARLLRADRPIIGLQLPALSDNAFHARTLDDLARHYLATIRRIQPQGPYHLLGYSLGGNIVHAVAAALEAAGEPVAYVGLVDSHPLVNLTERAARSLAEPAELDRLLPEIPEDAPELAAAIRDAATALLRMVTDSDSPRYHGVMSLFAGDTGTEPERAEAQLTGWRSVGARLVVRRLPYSHFDIVSPRGWTEVAALLDADPVIRA